MNILSVENITKTYGEKVLFQNVTVGVEEGEKIGLIGVNGTGKSTFLKVIAGLETPETGTITTGTRVTIEYLPQNPDFDANVTVLEQVFRGNSPVMQLLRAYETTVEQLRLRPDDAELQGKMIRLTAQMDAEHAWQTESEAKSVLTVLGITNFEARMGLLSGGQRKRVALASALIQPSDLLILDEPTNHLDNATIDWLEQYLAKRKGAVLMITHDRYFLDRVVNRILELDKGKLYSYDGNYADFLERKTQREAEARSSEEKRQNFLRNELDWVRRGVKARGTKQKARMQRYEQTLADTPDLSDAQIDISTASTRLGKKVIELHDIRKGYDERTLFSHFEYIVLPEDRIGIIGPNGSGKSTLLGLMSGRIQPEEGTIEVGSTVKVGYFSQESTEMNPDMRVIEYIKEEAEYVTTADGDMISASQMLERFLFPNHLQWTPIGKLSGGEKRRLFLLRILMGAPNVLLLDEPTNDLDVATLAILEQYLDVFAGAVITVSHDRYFLDRVTEKLFVFDGRGHITQFIGSYSDFIEQTEGVQKPESSVVEKSKSQDVQPVPVEKTKPLKFTYKEQKEFETIDNDIAEAERELQETQDQMNKAGGDYGLLQELHQKETALQEKLDVLIERWTYLNERAEEIEQSKRKES